MAIAEPDNELWAAVKQLADAWPPDDEDDVTELAANWRRAGKPAGPGGHRAGRPAPGSGARLA
ncbi:hypothetical protein [Amycolatopsis sp. NPDC051372]|uniref:WXG100-like domain-containing protein n=1 Tax=Amycolatopsis sp. NPDC051372 TaxID=3155669 RepID=UPI00342C3C24